MLIPGNEHVRDKVYVSPVYRHVMAHRVCSDCDWLSDDWTYVRQRIVCRRCWEFMGRDQVQVIPHSSGEEE